jgi:hypothetical protein
LGRPAGYCVNLYSFFDVGAVQRIYLCNLTPEEYVATEAHCQVRPEEICPLCGGCDCLQGHGNYGRGITQKTGLVDSMRVARFLCVATGRTVSYLPSFAFSYRLVQVSTFEAFLEGRLDRRDVQRWAEVLRQYLRRMRGFGAELLRVVGGGFGRAPPAPAPLWPYLKEACGSVAAATRRLVTQFNITLFARYQCHQPATAR